MFGRSRSRMKTYPNRLPKKKRQEKLPNHLWLLLFLLSHSVGYLISTYQRHRIPLVKKEKNLGPFKKLFWHIRAATVRQLIQLSHLTLRAIQKGKKKEASSCKVSRGLPTVSENGVCFRFGFLGLEWNKQNYSLSLRGKRGSPRAVWTRSNFF